MGRWGFFAAISVHFDAFSMNNVARGFNRLAPIYDSLARLVYGNSLRKAQTAFLEKLPKNAKILVLGGGSGWFLEQLILKAQPLEVSYLEISSKMIEQSKARIQKNLKDVSISRIQFIEADFEQVTIEGEFDAICTHCFLDLFGPAKLGSIMQKLKTLMKSGGIWYFSDFQHAGTQPMRWISKQLISLMYFFFRLNCQIDAKQLPAFESEFAKLKLIKKEEAAFYGGMIVARIYN